jgi:predicted ATPase/DNA-binding SARP family transcriptional activator
MLGPLEVRRDDGAVAAEVTGARLRALLILLALRPGQLATTSQLIDGLWGEKLPAEPVNALQALVSRLRRILPDAEIVAHQAGYQLKLDPEALDITRFERLAAAGRQRLQDDPAAAARTLREGLALWRGELDWTDVAPAVAARLAELRLTATQDRIAADLRLGDGQEVVAELEQLLAEHPLREPLAGLLMRALLASGRRGAALEVYERTRERLAEALGADPSPDLAALHLEILRADELDEPVTNLPAALTSFVGRDSDLAQVAGLLAAHRLVTLTGPGGAGKTRLAVEAARAELPGAPDGVWLVEFAPVTDPAEVAPAVLTALGLHEQALLFPASGGSRGSNPAARLIGALTAKRVLLLLDNCEHLITAAATLADRVLAACPGVRVLATSREPLNITGESLHPVGPLAIEPATALLTERARSVSPGFEGGPAVERICRSLDGMPLAIELAAARMRTMGPEQVAARLDDRFRLLTGGSRTALPRHQTLRAVVDWSWDLLDPAEQAVWRRFSSFTGGATLEAATAVCAGNGVDSGDMLDLLTALADKSVLTVLQDRYRMLEIIRAYGQERLAEAGERDQLRAAHGRYFLRLADEARDYLFGAEQLVWLRRLSPDQENLHAAIRAAVAGGDAQTAVGLTGSLGWYWYLRSMKAEGAELTGEALDLAERATGGAGGAADSAVPVKRLAIAYTMGGLLGFDTPHFGRAPGWLRSATELAATIPDARDPVLQLAPAMSLVLGSWTRGWDAVPAGAFDAATAEPDPWVNAVARVMRGMQAVNLGRQLGRAEEDFRAAYASFAGLGDRWGMATTLGVLADRDEKRADYTAAIARMTQAIGLAAELGLVEDEGEYRTHLVRLLWLDGRRERSAVELDRALRHADRTGWPETQAFAAFTAGELARLDGQPQAARAYLARAADYAVSPGIGAQLRAVIDTGRGYLAGAEGDLDAARAWHQQAWAAVRPTGDGPRKGDVLTGLADLALLEEDPGRAAELLGRAFTVRGTTDRSDVNGQRVADRVRAVLGDHGFDCAFRRGSDAAPEGGDGKRGEDDGERDRVEQ